MKIALDKVSLLLITFLVSATPLGAQSFKHGSARVVSAREDNFLTGEDPTNAYMPARASHDGSNRDGEKTRGVANGDFEKGESLEGSGWTWWSAHGKDAGSASFSNEARKGSRAVKVVHEGEMLDFNDWTLPNTARLDVDAGDEWTVSAWVKYEDTDRIGIEIMGMANGKEITQLHEIHRGFADPARQGLWKSGYDAAFGTGDWELLQASAVIPPEIDQVYVRLSGLGSTLAWVDDVQFRRGTAKRSTPPKPKVRGWAFDDDKRVADRLGRSVVAQALDAGRVYVRWRLLERDPDDIAFNVYRSENGGESIMLNNEPISATTDFMDKTANLEEENVYMVRSIDSKEPFGPSDRFTIPADAEIKPYLSIQLKDDKATFSQMGVGDLNGDGRYDFVIKVPGKGKGLAPSNWHPSETTYKLEAYLSDGTFLWRRDLGWNIETAIWYSPYVVYDFDGDGRAEVAVKTAPMDKDYRDKKPSHYVNGRYGYEPGRVNSGPEYVSILDGMTGEEKARADWPSRGGLGRYNHNARHQMGVAYLDGKTPSLLVSRGIYTLLKLEAYQYQDGELKQLWYWDATHEPGGHYFGQAAHTMHAADLDGDGRDEVLLGACAIDDNGDGLWSLGLFHTDNLFVSDIDPTRPGLEVYLGIEGSHAKGTLRNGICMVDAATGDLLWGLDKPTYHIHSRGLVSNIDPRHVGMECYSGERHNDDRWLHTAQGKLIGDETDWSVGLSPGAVYWDATPEREVVVGNKIVKFPDEVISNHLEGRQVASLDLSGDWREEIIVSLPGELRIYATDIPAEDRRVSLMEDPIYRNNVAHQSMGYNTLPLTSYYIGRE